LSDFVKISKMVTIENYQIYKSQNPCESKVIID
jgi:hypothetical protein